MNAKINWIWLWINWVFLIGLFEEWDNLVNFKNSNKVNYKMI
jgi:hypothetical protein